MVRLNSVSLLVLYLHSCTPSSVVMNNISRVLHEQLLANYEKDDMPYMTPPTPLPVAISFHMSSLMDLNELEGDMTTVGYLQVVWVDPRLTWNPYDYAGIASIMFMSTKIWTPNILQGNPSKKVTNFNLDIAKVRVLYNGTVMLTPGDVFQTLCAYDIYRYPFDYQDCHLSFVAWPYLATEVALYIRDTNILTPFYEDNGEWYLRGSTAQCYTKNSISVAEFDLHLERRSQFFIVNIVLPIVSICFLACLVFLIPHESGERNSYTITVLLSFAVFMTLVSDNIPKTSAPMSLLCYYLFALFFGSVIIMLNVIFNARLFYADKNVPVTPFYRKLVRRLTCKRRRKKSGKNKVHAISVIEDSMLEESAHYLKKLDLLADEKQADIPVTWVDVAYALDKVCFVLYAMYFISLSCGIVIYVQLA